MEGWIGHEGCQKLPYGGLVGRDIHKVQHSFKAGDVLILIVGAEGDEGLEVAEQLVPSKAAYLINSPFVLLF